MAGADIQEVPLDSEAPPTISEENTVETSPENAAPAKRGRGRPPGAKNKPRPPTEPAPPSQPVHATPKAKQKPKVKAKAKAYAPASESESSEEEVPPARRARRPHASSASVANPEMERAQLAAEVLSLLQRQHVARASARRHTYASWFAHMGA